MTREERQIKRLMKKGLTEQKAKEVVAVGKGESDHDDEGWAKGEEIKFDQASRR